MSHIFDCIVYAGFGLFGMVLALYAVVSLIELGCKVVEYMKRRLPK